MTSARHGEPTTQALGRVEVDGLVANAPFLARVVGHPAFRAGRTTTSFVDTHKAELIG